MRQQPGKKRKREEVKKIEKKAKAKVESLIKAVLRVKRSISPDIPTESAFSLTWNGRHQRVTTEVLYADGERGQEKIPFCEVSACFHWRERKGPKNTTVATEGVQIQMQITTVNEGVRLD